MYSYDFDWLNTLDTPDVKTLKEPIMKVKENSKLKITEVNDQISSILAEARTNDYYFPTNKYVMVDAQIDFLYKKLTLLKKEMMADIDVALNNAFYEYADLFSKKQIKNKIVMACECQLCESCVDSGVSVKVVDNYPIVIMCNGCFNKIESIKRTIVCPTKILLIPFILDLPELQNLICEAFLSIV
jgi:hypothetical protein